MAVRGVKGVRIYLGGRLGGAEIARTENMKKGSILFKLSVPMLIMQGKKHICLTGILE